MKPKIVALLLVYLWWFLIFYVGRSHGEQTTPRQQKDVAIHGNHFRVVYGYIEEASIYVMNGKFVTVVLFRINGKAVITRYDFCDDMSEMFEMKGHSTILVYDQVIHEDRCNRLIDVEALFAGTWP